jgi:hypothetical protein
VSSAFVANEHGSGVPAGTVATVVLAGFAVVDPPGPEPPVAEPEVEDVAASRVVDAFEEAPEHAPSTVAPARSPTNEAAGTIPRSHRPVLIGSLIVDMSRSFALLDPAETW